ncbi:MAG: tryptophan--tRNA ligase [Bdellovibrionales bacterium]|nr:tryptophan--tRNA ligase [Bdellovibrionales bacterium]
MSQKTILTGVKPTGQPHLGNYLGAMKPAIELSKQPKTQTYLFIADYHSLITVHKRDELNHMIYEVAATWLACGLDPSRTCFYKQSSIPEIFELNWILSCFTPKGLLNRAHAYKAKIQENQELGRTDLDTGVSMGLFNYPVLMAADIVIFNADEIPVGEDQIQHLEMARDMVQKFNRQYGEVLRLPQFSLKRQKLIPGLDGRKMSKSYDNHIFLFLEEKKLRKQIMKIKTDSLPPEAPKDPNQSTIFELYQFFASESQIEALRQRYLNGIGWGEAKEELFQLLNSHLAKPREEYRRWMNEKAELEKLLIAGADRARQEAQQLLKKVRQAIGVES